MRYNDSKKQGAFAMSDNNICKFISQKSNGNDLYPLHYVLETHPQTFDKWRILAHYRMHFVLSGKAVYHTQNGKFDLKKGDVFFSLTSVPYGLESVEDFQYIYIGFTGTRALQLLDKLGINEKSFIFSGFDQDENLWTAPLRLHAESIKVYAEGILLCTFARLIEQKDSLEEKQQPSEISAKIKKYVDENFNNPNLSLEYLADKFSYNKKYLSKIFIQEFHVRFTDYLQNIRIQNACALVEKGFEGIQDIAYLSGFSDPLYFSKVFKKITGTSPRQHVQLIKNQKKNGKDD